MLIETFPHAVAGAALIAVTCSLLGVFVILKRIVFIGVAVSQVAVLGVAVAFVTGLHPYLGAGILTFLTVVLLAYPFESNRLPRDAVMGLVFVLASALSILIVSQSGFGRHEVEGLLYGDLIFITPLDLTVIAAVLLPLALCVLLFRRPTVYAFMDREMSRVLGIRATVWELAFFVALGLAVAVASRTAGSLLVFCYLVVAPSTGLLLSRRLNLVLVISAAAALGATLAGLYLAVGYDLPTNHTVAAAACLLFLLAAGVPLARWLWRLFRPAGEEPAA